MSRVYVAGPYSQGNVNRNVAAAMAVGAQILDAGHTPFVPHLSHFWDVSHPRDYEVWMAWDLAWLRQCDALVRIAGPSSGADREVACAREMKMPVFDAGSEGFAMWMREQTPMTRFIGRG
jgi:hypothetical protein